MEITYCDEWFLSEKRPLNLLDEKTAKLRHDKREAYAAVLSEQGQPQYVVKLVSKWVGVIFLDDLIRPYMRYNFKEIEKGKIFLTSVVCWEYKDESDEESKSIELYFKENGETIMSEWDRETGDIIERVGNFSTDPNWDVYPEFGDYLHLCREERE